MDTELKQCTGLGHKPNVTMLQLPDEHPVIWCACLLRRWHCSNTWGQKESPQDALSGAQPDQCANPLPCVCLHTHKTSYPATLSVPRDAPANKHQLSHSHRHNQVPAYQNAPVNAPAWHQSCLLPTATSCPSTLLRAILLSVLLSSSCCSPPLPALPAVSSSCCCVAASLARARME